MPRSKMVSTRGLAVNLQDEMEQKKKKESNIIYEREKSIINQLMLICPLSLFHTITLVFLL